MQIDNVDSTAIDIGGSTAKCPKCAYYAGKNTSPYQSI